MKLFLLLAFVLFISSASAAAARRNLFGAGPTYDKCTISNTEALDRSCLCGDKFCRKDIFNHLMIRFCLTGEVCAQGVDMRNEGADLEMCYDIKTTPGAYEGEASWTITPEGSSTPSCRKGDQNCCFTSGTHAISCKDSYGDGWNGYQLFVNEVQKCDPFRTGSEATDELIVAAQNYVPHQCSISDTEALDKSCLCGDKGCPINFFCLTGKRCSDQPDNDCVDNLSYCRWAAQINLCSIVRNSCKKSCGMCSGN